MIDKIKQHSVVIIYVLLAVLTIIAYPYMIDLIAIRSAWLNIVLGKVSVSFVAALIMWVVIIEQIAKKRNWSNRRTWIMLLLVPIILLLIIMNTEVVI